MSPDLKEQNGGRCQDVELRTDRQLTLRVFDVERVGFLLTSFSSALFPETHSRMGALAGCWTPAYVSPGAHH